MQKYVTIAIYSIRESKKWCMVAKNSGWLAKIACMMVDVHVESSVTTLKIYVWQFVRESALLNIVGRKKHHKMVTR